VNGLAEAKEQELYNYKLEANFELNNYMQQLTGLNDALEAEKCSRVEIEIDLGLLREEIKFKEDRLKELETFVAEVNKKKTLRVDRAAQTYSSSLHFDKVTQTIQPKRVEIFTQTVIVRKDSSIQCDQEANKVATSKEKVPLQGNYLNELILNGLKKYSDSKKEQQSENRNEPKRRTNATEPNNSFQSVFSNNKRVRFSERIFEVDDVIEETDFQSNINEDF